MSIHIDKGMVIALGLLVAACGGGGGASGGGSGAVGGATAGAAATGPIKVWYSNNKEEVTWAEAILTAWNQDHPDEQVTGEQIPAGNEPEEVIGASITAGNTPCLIFNTSPAAVPQFQRQGGLVALDDFPDAAAYIQERTGAVADQYKFTDGKFYQMPWKTNPVMIFYNKEVFAAAGIATDDPPLKTYADFLQTSKTLVEKGGVEAAIWPAPTSEFYQPWFDFYPLLIAATGGKGLVEDGEPQFTTPEGLAVAEFWRQMYAEKLAPNEAYQGDSFGDGKAAMAIVGPWAIAVYGDKVDWGAVPVPTAQGTDARGIHTFSDEKSISMYTSCQNRGTAWEALEFATSEDSDGMLLDTTGQMPMRTNLVTAYPAYFESHPEYELFADQASRTVEVPIVPNSVEVWQTFRTAYSESVIFGSKPIDQAFTDAATETKSLVGGSETMAVAAAPHERRLQKLFGREPIGLVFIAPYAIFLAALFAFPLMNAVYISFFDYFFAAPGAVVDRPFVGLANYAEILADPAFRQAVVNVGVFILINLPLTVVLSLILAAALNAKLPFQTFFRVAYYIPYVTASVAVISVWLWLFSAGGLVNTLLGQLAPDPSWLVNEVWAMPMIALFVTWKRLGFYVILYLAALQNIPRELYEAAVVDGAAVVQRFINITVPGVSSVTFLVVVLTTIIGLNLFTEPYLLTGGGGPNGASTFPVLLMYQKGIEQGQAGYASAIGVILAIVALTIAAVQRYVLDRQ